MCGATAWACRWASVSHFSITTKVSSPKLAFDVGMPCASIVAPYSMQPSSASTAARLAAKASSSAARWPGLAVMTATTWIIGKVSED
ncbi:Uncharacterised protein [Mycobacterium tuberculosis]|nr:Uncharacterised protein [Mycobacterium tuberculosis]